MGILSGPDSEHWGVGHVIVAREKWTAALAGVGVHFMVKGTPGHTWSHTHMMNYVREYTVLCLLLSLTKSELLREEL